MQTNTHTHTHTLLHNLPGPLPTSLENRQIPCSLGLILFMQAMVSLKMAYLLGSTTEFLKRFPSLLVTDPRQTSHILRSFIPSGSHLVASEITSGFMGIGTIWLSEKEKGEEQEQERVNIWNSLRQDHLLMGPCQCSWPC